MPTNLNGQAPTETSIEDFPLQDLYDFNGATLEDNITLDIAGKAKTITKGNGDTIEISPNFKGTLTNLDTADADTFDFVATGTIQRSENDDGTIDVTYNGLNLVGNPYLNPPDGEGDLGYALVQTRGHFYNTEDPAGTTPSEIFGPLEGNGQILYIVDDFGFFV